MKTERKYVAITFTYNMLQSLATIGIDQLDTHRGDAFSVSAL
jgi:hypothetical protein